MKNHRPSRIIGVIADDLTGAGDTGLAFRQAGLEAVVLFPGRRSLADSKVRCPSTSGTSRGLAQRLRPYDTSGTSVVVIDTENRNEPARAAVPRVQAAARRLQRLGCAHFYLKIDSTLRGHLGIEINAVLDALGCEVALITPAFPRQGRTLREGRLYVHGQPVETTSLREDPCWPVREGHLPTLLRPQSRRPVALVDWGTVRRGAAEIQAALCGVTAHGAVLAVLDAETDEDLAEIAAAGSEWGERVLWVGSAGLAYHLARRVTSDECRVTSDECPESGTSSLATRYSSLPVLIAAGSLSPVTAAQVDFLVATGAAERVVVTEPSEGWHGGTAPTSSLRAGRDVVLVPPPPALSCLTTSSGTAGWHGGPPLRCLTTNVDPAAARRMARRLGWAAAEIVSRQSVGGLVLTGGETAIQVCQALGASGLRLLAEVEPGVPVSQLVGGPHAGLLVCTKAGAFGDERTLWRAVEWLKEP